MKFSFLFPKTVRRANKVLEADYTKICWINFKFSKNI